MEESTLYDLISFGLLREWKNKAYEQDDCGFKEKERELKNQLTLELDEKNRKILSEYSTAIKDRMDDITYEVNIKILNFGIKIGMELQKAFKEHDDLISVPFFAKQYKDDTQ